MNELNHTQVREISGTINLRKETEDFSNTRVILVKKDDSRICFRRETECYVEQSFDTPTYIAIGENVTQKQLMKVSEMYKYPLADLITFRDAIQSS